MPAAEPATVERAGATLRFVGVLQRDAIAALWKHAAAQAGGAERFDLAAVTRVDSAGVALLAELAARAGTAVAIDGMPPGLAELRAAYRLTPALAFA
jgi:phospholipid transport system transporter-binding protein